MIIDAKLTHKILFCHPQLNWPTYSSVIAGHRSADVVFVDGRFRVACICAALLYTAPGTIIMVHDWIRSRYHVVLEHAEVIDVVKCYLNSIVSLSDSYLNVLL